MYCAWKELRAILPGRLRSCVDERMEPEEIRLRLGQPVELVTGRGSVRSGPAVEQGDLELCIQSASRYSPWAAATLTQGFLTAPGGHRIGVCGEVAVRNGEILGIRNVTSLCIRVARDIRGIAKDIPTDRSLIILGAPGWGKTTLLRDLVRSTRVHTAVVDERGELFPRDFHPGPMTDVLTGCAKAAAIPMLLRTMGPKIIAVDEITEPEDTTAIVHAANCGVLLLATAHAGSLEEFRSRPVYAPLLRHRIFQTAAVLHKDRSCRLERME